MKENNLEELIDGFLQNKLNRADQARLQEIINSDPQADKLLKESQETYRYILHLRYKKLRDELRKHDELETVDRKPVGVKRFFIAASILALVALGSYFVAVYSFSPRLVAKRNFEAIPVAGLLPEISEYILTAEEFFSHENFHSAAKVYEPIIDLIDDKYAQDAKWNLLMCQLVVEGPSQEWKKKMLVFTADAGEHFKMKGYKILRLYNSPFYRLSSSVLTRTFSPVKPRLI